MIPYLRLTVVNIETHVVKSNTRFQAELPAGFNFLSCFFKKRLL